MQQTTDSEIAHDTLEVWIGVSGFEGLYEISSHGRIMALFPANNGQLKAGRLLKPFLTPNGYLQVTLYLPETGNHFRKSVHAVVLESFKGKRPARAISRHLDGNRQNNTPENLEWGTSKENADDAKRHGTFVIGEKNGFSKLTEIDVVEIRRRRDAGETCKAIAKSYGIDWSNVWLIGKRKSWKHVAEA